MVVVGVDAGATRTRALALRDDGTVVGSGDAGPANPRALGPAKAAVPIAQAARRAAGRWRPRLLVAGVAGAGEASTRKTLERLLRLRRAATEVHVTHDAAVALEGALPGRPGIVVIAGTGAIAFGRNGRGEEARAGGWGPLVDDEGSGFAIGREILRRVVRAVDGRAPETPLTPIVLQALGLQGPSSLPAVASEMSPRDVARVAGAVMALGAGDGEAALVLSQAAAELVLAARAVWTRLRLSRVHPVALAGGLFTHEPFRALVADAVRAALPQARMVSPRFPPEAGAALMALAMQGVRPVETLLVKLEGGAPRPGLLPPA